MCGYAGTTTRDLPMAYMGCAKDCPVKTLADCQGTCKVDATCTAFSFYSTGIRGNCLYWTKAGYGPNAAREATVAACHVRKTEGWAVYKITEVPLVPAYIMSWYTITPISSHASYHASGRNMPPPRTPSVFMLASIALCTMLRCASAVAEAFVSCVMRTRSACGHSRGCATDL